VKGKVTVTSRAMQAADMQVYQACVLCDGFGGVSPARCRICDASRDRALNRRDDGTIECPGCSGQGMVEVGVTVGQVERMAALEAWRQERRGKLEALLVGVGKLICQNAGRCVAAEETLAQVTTVLVRLIDDGENSAAKPDESQSANIPI
jgi:RecJ-like exonuclease